MRRVSSSALRALSRCTVGALFFFSLPVHSQTSSPPPAVTSLTAETANNTAADNNWRGSFNGVPKGGNISPLPLSSLLPAGSTTKFIAHLVPFFTSACQGNPKNCHVNVGYDQNDSAVIARQIADMRRRGFSIIFLDWYGPQSAHTDGIAQKIMQESEQLQRVGADFLFALTPDKGIAGKCALDQACNTHKLIESLTYASKTYFNSPAYLRIDGRPVVPLFWFDATHPVDWSQVAAEVQGHPIFVFINSTGFRHPQSGGAFAWEGIKAPTDDGLAYLDNFYKVASENTQRDEVVIGSAYPGFDDRLASWGHSKIGDRRCGLTWLESVNESLQYQKLTGRYLPYLQVVTWNDYEEGTAVEPGIDNCVAAIPSSVQGNHLSWNVTYSSDAFNFTGNELTIAYYRIFAALGGDAIQELARIPTNANLSGRYNIDLAPFHLQSGQKLYIEAVGKSMIFNHISDAVTVP